MNREDMKIIAATLVEFYTPRLMPVFTSFGIDMWTKMLEDLPVDKVQLAIASWIQTERFPPTIADIREKCIQDPADEMTPEQAWQKVCYALRHFGPYEPEQTVREYLGELWDLIGPEWMYYNRMLESDQPNEKARFIRMYAAHVHREKYRAQISAPILAALESGRLQIGDSKTALPPAPEGE